MQPITGPDGGSLTFLHLVAVREIGERVIAELVVQQSAGINGHPVNGGNDVAIDASPPVSLTDLSLPASE
jgi:hypothetical protein